MKIVFINALFILVLSGCVPSETPLSSGEETQSSFSISPAQTSIAPSGQVRLLIEGGRPPFQIEVANTLYGNAFIDNSIDSNIISVLAN